MRHEKFLHFLDQLTVNKNTTLAFCDESNGNFLLRANQRLQALSEE